MVHITLIYIILSKIISVCFYQYDVGCDEAWKLQAAVRLFEGDGYTVSMDDNAILRTHTDKDASNSVYTFLTHWPPLYSILIYVFLLFGLNSTLALSVLNTTLFCFGILGWYKVGDTFLQRPLAKASFLISIALVMFPYTETSMFAWSLFSYIILLLERLIDGQRSIISFILLCLISLMLIFLRYQMIVLVVSIPILLIWFLPKHRFSFAVIFGIVTLGGYFAFRLFLLSNNLSTISVAGYLRLSNFTTMLSSISLFLPNLLTGYDIAYRMSTQYKILIAFVFHAILVAILYISLTKHKIKPNRRISLFLVVFALCNFALLAVNGDYRGYNIFIHARYWWWINPLVFLFFIDILDKSINVYSLSLLHLRERLRSAYYITLYTMAMLAFTIYTYKAVVKSDHYYYNYNILTQYLDSTIIRNNLSPSKLIVFVGMDDPNSLSSILLQQNMYPVYRRFDILLDDDIYFSKDEVPILMVYDTSNWKDMISDAWRPELLSSANNYSIYRLDRLVH